MSKFIVITAVYLGGPAVPGLGLAPFFVASSSGVLGVHQVQPAVPAFLAPRNPSNPSWNVRPTLPSVAVRHKNYSRFLYVLLPGRRKDMRRHGVGGRRHGSKCSRCGWAASLIGRRRTECTSEGIRRRRPPQMDISFMPLAEPLS